MATAAPIQCISSNTTPVALSSGDGERRWLKDVLVAERLVNEAQGWTLDLNPDKLNAYAAAFDSMKANGVTVPVTLDHSASATAVVGYVEDLFVQGDRLYARLTTNGMHANLPEVVRTVSVEIEPDFTDGRGNKYGEAVTAVSIVKSPVVPNQHNFIPLGLDPERVLYLSMTAAPSGRKVAAMPDYEDKDKKKDAAMENEEETNDASTDAPEGDDSAPVKASAEAMAPLISIAESVGLVVPPGASLDEVLTTIIATIQSMKEAAKPAESSPTSEVLALSLDSASARFEKLEGTELVFDKAAVKRLVETLAGTDAKPNAKMLSLGADNKSPARKVAELLLSLAKPIQTATNPTNRMDFSRDAPPNGGDDSQPAIGSRESMLETAKGRNLNPTQRKALGMAN